MRLTFWLLLATASVAAPALATAATRDDVVYSALRCAPVGDSRVWLDCYYGAAQPMRAQLSLPPAPEAQQRIALAPPQGGTVTDAGVRNAVISGALGCSSVVDDRQWLNCYYGAAQPIRAQLGLSAAPQAPPPAPQLGLPPAPKPSPLQGSNRVISRIIATSFNSEGAFTVTLDNGEVWRELPGDTERPHWSKKLTYTAVITPGAFGSFDLRTREDAQSFKVERLK